MRLSDGGRRRRCRWHRHLQELSVFEIFLVVSLTYIDLKISPLLQSVSTQRIFADGLSRQAKRRLRKLPQGEETLRSGTACISTMRQAQQNLFWISRHDISSGSGRNELGEEESRTSTSSVPMAAVFVEVVYGNWLAVSRNYKQRFVNLDPK